MPEVLAEIYRDRPRRHNVPCKNCGQPFHPRTRDTSRCDACLAKCQRCGKPIARNCGAVRYCDGCRGYQPKKK
jgi:hypothetical protein